MLPKLNVTKENKKTIQRLSWINFACGKYSLDEISAKKKIIYQTKMYSYGTQPFRFGKKTTGEVVLSNKASFPQKGRKKQEQEESLLVICQKINYIKNRHNKVEKCLSKYPEKEPFRFHIPAFPSRKEFVLRKKQSKSASYLG